MKRITKKVNKRHSETVFFDSFTEYKNYIASYANKPANEWKLETNKEVYERYWSGDGIRADFTGTDSHEECRNLRSYIAGENLAKLRDKVAGEVASIPVEDVRKRVRFNGNPEGEFVPDRYFAGDTRKSFATLGKKRAIAPAVTIVLTMGYNCDIKPFDQAPYNSLAGIVFAEMLLKKGYSVTIHIVECSVKTDRNGGKLDTYSIIKAKDSSNYLDPDTLAILASDPRTFRFWGFLSKPIECDRVNKRVCFSLGHSPSVPAIERHLQAIDFKYDFIFGQAFSHQAAVAELRKNLAKLNNSRKQSA